MIPEDSVPIKIQATTKHSTDIDLVIREHKGYVPSDATDEING